MHEVRYPLLFAGCGDEICMPFRGERCYIRQCPECDPKNLGTSYYGEDLYNKYKDCIDSNECYNIRYCFCPPEGNFDFNLDKCPNDVRDSYGCVLIKDINQEAKAPCQCGWNKRLTFTTVHYGEGIYREEKHYCCPENAQIDFGYRNPRTNKGFSLLDPTDHFDPIENAHCGNMTIQLAGICVPEDEIILRVDYHESAGLGKDIVGSFASIYNYITNALENHVRSRMPSLFQGKLVYFMNYTYYDPYSKNWIKIVESTPRKAPIYLKDCDFDDVLVPYTEKKEECRNKGPLTGICYGGYTLELYYKGELSGYVDCSWFADWNIYRCKTDIYYAYLDGFKCKNFTAYTMEGLVNWQNAPYQGTSADGDYVYLDICPIWTDITNFNVTDISGENVTNYTADFTRSPPRGYD